MNFVGSEVEHPKYGNGQIVSVSSEYVQVAFESVGLKMFQYPEAFEKFLNLVNPADKSKLSDLLREHNRREDEKKRKREELRLRLEGDIQQELKERFERQKNSESSKKSSDKKDRVLVNNLIFHCDIDENKSETEKKYGNHISKNDIAYENSDENFESETLRDKIVYSGFYQTGSRSGQGVRLARLKEGSLVVLTICPDDRESNREVIGLFLVDEFFKGSETESAWVKNSSHYFLKLSKEEASRMKLWSFFARLGQNMPLRLVAAKYRYFADNEAAYILREASELKVGTEDELRAREMFEYFCEINNIDKTLRFND